jgi:phosphopantothenoylcysteine decarboxylase/phosphopantothenate--cysteine ligase
MEQPDSIVSKVSSLFQNGLLAGKKVVLTAGPTREALDPVRYISNHSSGKMAYALAAEAVAAGAKVTLISGPVNLPTPESVKRIDVISAAQMLAATHEAIADCDVFIGVAAVADYRPAEIAAQKIKKSDEQMQLTLIKNPDIISEVAQLEEKPFVVGFAAETNDIVSNGRDKLRRKNLDMLFANNATRTFNSDSIFVTSLTETSETELKAGNKNVVARNMLQLIATALNEQ